MEYGYARISTKDQNLDRQIKLLAEAGVDKRCIYKDIMSGKTFNRPAYNTLVGTENTMPLLRSGDLLTICSIDRLGRNYEEIREQWRRITHELQCDIRVLDMPLLDTRNAESGNNTDKMFIADLVLQILSYVAEKERLNTHARQAQGLAAMPVINGKRVSRKTGNPVGRPAAIYPENWKPVYERWQAKDITAVQAMAELGLKKNTFYNLVKRARTNEPST